MEAEVATAGFIDLALLPFALGRSAILRPRSSCPVPLTWTFVDDVSGVDADYLTDGLGDVLPNEFGDGIPP